MATTLYSCGIIGAGSFLPEKILTNHDLEQMVDTSDEWIVTRTGIRQRHICSPGETASTMGAEACRDALKSAGIEASEIDLIICCTFTADHSCPSTACLIQSLLGISRQCAAFDLSAACTGFIYGCSVGASFIRSGVYKNVLVVGSEAMSSILDFQDRNTCVLFGDGAGAVVLSRVDEGKGLLGQCLGADGDGGDLIIVPAGGSREPLSEEVLKSRRQFIRMTGNEVYKFATRILGKAVEDALEDTHSGLTPADLDVIVPHQANIRILEVASRKLGVPMDRFVVNIAEYGNTSAASVPLALADAWKDGRISAGSLVAMVGFGGGLTYAASIWRI